MVHAPDLTRPLDLIPLQTWGTSGRPVRHVAQAPPPPILAAPALALREAALSDFFISADDLRARIATADAPIIYDVCRAEKFCSFDTVIPTARWRDHTQVHTWANAIPYGADVVVACVHGHNVSQLAVSALRERGIAARVLAGGNAGWKAAGLPTIRKDALPGRDENGPSRWVTRIRPKIDRIACPWLIRRFIDRDAEFLFVEPAYVVDVAKDVGGIPYDIDGVAFTHKGPECSFDTIIKAFAIRDAALDTVATIVRGADTARLDLAPEAAGLLAVSLGISALSGGDDRAALARGFPMYDALYAWARHAKGETHNWPAKSA
jgi:rhodanese-related sulfurtransferase